MTDPNRNQERLLSFRAVFALAGVFYNTSTVSSKYLTFILFLLLCFLTLSVSLHLHPCDALQQPFPCNNDVTFFLAGA